MTTTNKFKTATYETGTEGFYVDVVKHLNKSGMIQCDAWIYEESYGIKMHMFGMEICTEIGKTYGDFLETVESNLDGYIEDYREEYMD